MMARYNTFCYHPLGEISGLMVWLNAGVGTFQDAAMTIPATDDTDPVGGWADQSGQGNHETQATASKRPILQLNEVNGKPAILFDITNSCCLQSAAFAAALAQPNTVFVVCHMPAADGSTRRYAIDGIDDSNRHVIWKDITDEVKIFAGSSVETTAALNVWEIIAVVFNGANSKAWVNGAVVGTGNAGNQLLRGLTVGIYYDGVRYCFDDSIAEILIYDSALSDANRQAVENYLNVKYALY